MFRNVQECSGTFRIIPNNLYDLADHHALGLWTPQLQNHQGQVQGLGAPGGHNHLQHWAEPWGQHPSFMRSSLLRTTRCAANKKSAQYRSNVASADKNEVLVLYGNVMVMEMKNYTNIREQKLGAESTHNTDIFKDLFIIESSASMLLSTFTLYYPLLIKVLCSRHSLVRMPDKTAAPPGTGRFIESRRCEQSPQYSQAFKWIGTLCKPIYYRLCKGSLQKKKTCLWRPTPLLNGSES